ncbi:MAG: M20/M25/M40 family metallo-hydrolase [Acidobacteriota bacterium]
MDRTAATDFLRGLVSIPSPSRHEAAAVDFLVGQMHAAGYERASVDEAGNAVGELGAADARRTIVLLGHIDTVPGNIPVRIADTEKGAVLYGRGSVDAKGPLATFVAAGARLGEAWARDASVRLVVVGAVEEEAATSKGARFIAARFDGTREPVPDACVIGEPSHWHRITLGYKGRLLLDLEARQPMAHTAGPDPGVASVVVDLWNWVAQHAATLNVGRDKAFDQLTPSLRRFVTATTQAMDDTADAQIAWRLPLGVDAESLVSDLVSWTARHIEAPDPSGEPGDVLEGASVALTGTRTSLELCFRGWEHPWKSDRHNDLVRSLLAAIRAADPDVQPSFVLKTGTSDMNLVAPLWRCPIVAYGPGDSALDHTPNEHVSLDEYWRAIGVVEAMLRGWAAGRTRA